MKAAAGAHAQPTRATVPECLLATPVKRINKRGRRRTIRAGVAPELPPKLDSELIGSDARRADDAARLEIGERQVVTGSRREIRRRTKAGRRLPSGEGRRSCTPPTKSRASKARCGPLVKDRCPGLVQVHRGVSSAPAQGVAGSSWSAVALAASWASIRPRVAISASLMPPRSWRSNPVAARDSR